MDTRNKSGHDGGEKPYPASSFPPLIRHSCESLSPRRQGAGAQFCRDTPIVLYSPHGYIRHMFHRRKKLALIERMREFIWPRSGWKRSTRYAFHRVARISDSAHSIAAGFAFGAAASFTPFVGLHFILAAAMAWLGRANILSSAIGTVVGNPWTFPFIWIWVYELGTWMGGKSEGAGVTDMDFASFFGAILDALLSLDFAYLIEVAGPAWWPMFLGSIPSAILVWIVFYLAMKPMVAAYQNRRILRRHHRKIAREQEKK